MKKLKIKIKGFLVLKIAKLRKEIKAYKERLAEDVIREQEYIDKISLMQSDIRDLLLKLPKEEREEWMKGKNYERYFTKAKRIKK